MPTRMCRGSPEALARPTACRARRSGSTRPGLEPGRCTAGGDDTGQGRANCRDDHCADGFPNTAPVGSFRANPWGLHDVHGNVSEWVQDCLDNARSYIRAPSDGSAWEYENCGRRMLRGGSWENSPPYVRVASRRGDASDGRRHGLGFRIARTLVHPVGTRGGAAVSAGVRSGPPGLRPRDQPLRSGRRGPH